jgi:hypothetical protein
MENKYYTPTIEEFHVGFEYEDGSLYGKNEWTKLIVSTQHSLEETEYILQTNRIRVKYLDSSDIESLGFTQIGYDSYEKSNWFIDLDEKQLIFIYSQTGKVYFQGNIKNISELRVILKQLNIS